MSSTAVPAPAMADDEKSTNQILQALDALSHTLYQARANLRATSLALPRSAGDGNDADAAGAETARPRSRRLSLMAPFRSRRKVGKNENGDDDDDDDDDEGNTVTPLKSQPDFAAVTAQAAAAADGEKKGRIWSWAPIRALSHIGMRRMGCLFSVEVVAAQGLPTSINGLRLAVAVRKKETRDGAVQTMPTRVQQGAADFDETLFIRCHLYGSGGGGATGNKPLRFEPRAFVLSLVAVDAPELDFGRSAVDLSLFAKEFTDKCQQGECVRQWDMVFPLAGKAKGGELVIKLAFQSIDDGGAGLYSQPAAEPDRTSSSSSSLSSFTRKLRKSSFSMMLTPKMTRMGPSLTTPKMDVPSPDLRGIDNFKLDDEVTPVVEAKEKQHKEATEEKHKEVPEPVMEEQQKETPEQETEEQHKEATESETEEQHKKAPEQETEEQQKEAPKQETEEQHKEALEPETEVQQKEAPEQETEVQQKQAPKQETEEQHKEVPEEQQTEPEQETEGTQAHDDLEMPEFDVVDKGVETQEEKDELKEEATGDEVVKEVLEPTTMLSDVSNATMESVEPPPQEDGTVLDDANKDEATVGGGGNGAAAKSRPAPIGWPAIAIVVAPVAVLLSKTLARR